MAGVLRVALMAGVLRVALMAGVLRVALLTLEFSCCREAVRLVPRSGLVS